MEAITWVTPDLNGEIIEREKGGQGSQLVEKVRGGKRNREGKKIGDEKEKQ